jgi:hypothetical protein
LAEPNQNRHGLQPIGSRDRTETVSLHELFNRMTQAELEEYAKTGELPAWFRAAVGATSTQNHLAASDGN